MSNATNNTKLDALKKEHEELLVKINGGTLKGKDLDDAKAKADALAIEINKLESATADAADASATPEKDEAADAPTADAADASATPEKDEATEAEATISKSLIAIAATIVVAIVITVATLWSSSSKDEAATVTAASAKYFISLGEVKEAFQTSMFRTWDMEYERRANALQAWVPAYRALYVGTGLTSSKEEALLYSYGLSVSLYMEAGTDPAASYRQVAAASTEELKALLLQNYPEDCEAVLKALQ